MQNSSRMIKTTNMIGRAAIRGDFLKTPKTKEPNIFRSVCPANILANNRTAKLNGLIKYEITSIRTKKGSKITGTPLGINSFKNFIWLLIIFIIVIPKKIENAS